MKTIAEYEKEITIAFIQGDNEKAHELMDELYTNYPRWTKGDVPDKED